MSAIARRASGERVDARSPGANVGAPRAWRLAASGALVVVCVLLAGGPVGALVSIAAGADLVSLREALARAALPALALNVALLAAGATAVALVAAVPVAWLVARTDVPFGQLWGVLAPLPLAIPPYVAALAYATLLGPGGTLHLTVARWLGVPLGQIAWPPLVYGTGGAAFILGLFTAPAVFLLIYAALVRANPSLEDASRGLGLGPWRTLIHVTLPVLLPALSAGALLVCAYAFVDFGVVSLLRTRTVTTALYTYLLSGYSRPASAVIALALVAAVWGLLALQAMLLCSAREREAQGSRSYAGARPVRLGAWRWPAALYCAAIVALSLVVPVAVLATEAARLGAGGWLSFTAAQVPYLWRSLAVAAAGASIAVALGLALALARGRLAGVTPAAFALQAGYGIPGTVLGLALVGLLLRVAPPLYGTPGSLVVAYVILFAAPAYQACRAAVAQVSPALEAAARGLGAPPPDVIRRVVLPLAFPGVAGAWALSFALAFRELAATIIIRPAGFDTLAVRIWVHTMDVGPDARAAAVALLLLAVASVVWLAAFHISGHAARVEPAAPAR